MGDQIARTVQYFYFIRFSLFVWLFPVVFAVADAFATGSITRGIFVPEFWSGYCCVAFFLVCKGFVALICARTVLINGRDRFKVAPPTWMEHLFVNDRAEGEWKPPLIALIPATLVFTYLLFVGLAESVLWCHIVVGLATGTVAALAFSYVVNAWYYLAYERPKQSDPAADPASDKRPSIELGRNAARTILFPRWCFTLNPPGMLVEKAPQTLEDIDTSLRGSWLSRNSLRAAAWLAHRINLTGYVYLEKGAPQNDRIFEAHIFAFIATVAFTGIFWILYFLTAPGESAWVRLSVLALILFLAFVLRIISSGHGVDAPLLKKWKIGLSLLSTAFCLLILSIFAFTSPDRFPVLASVVLLITVFGWFLSLLAFFFDCFRVPILTLFLLLILVPRLLHLYDGSEEHYVSTVSLSEQSAPISLPTPAEIVGARLQHDIDNPLTARPFVIVTATGGGLHASAWTDRILEQIDCAFLLDDALAHDPRLDPKDFKCDRPSFNPATPTQADLFRDHILLMSTVSGGSVGLNYYLSELQAKIDETKPQEGRPLVPAPPNYNRMIVAAQCSSLEAVGWGLVYYDFEKAIFPVTPSLLPHSSGDDDLGASPIFKDRTWALRRAFLRNTSDEYCLKTAEDDEGKAAVIDFPKPTFLSHLRKLWFASLPRVWPPRTLAGFIPRYGVPAFTINTTTAELGDRFLLANYRLPTSYKLFNEDVSPAESFLDVLKARHADLPLVSAAQLSATFPYVSSAVRLPVRYGCYSEHFVDGGYYDNDGTASAIEFLRYALQSPLEQPVATGEATEAVKVGELLKARNEPLRVILIEIRNSVDTDAPAPGAPPRVVDSARGSGTDPHTSGLLQQLTYPLDAFWSAGHESVTSRNRNGLDLLQSSLGHELALRHIILDDATEPTSEFGVRSANDPLSWSLTPRERKQVRQAAEPNNGLENCYREIVNQFKSFDVVTATAPTHCHGAAPLKIGATAAR